MTGEDSLLPRGHGADDLEYLLQTIMSAKDAGKELEFLDWFLGEYNVRNHVYASVNLARIELDF